MHCLVFVFWKIDVSIIMTKNKLIQFLVQIEFPLFLLQLLL